MKEKLAFSRVALIGSCLINCSVLAGPVEFGHSSDEDLFAAYRETRTARVAENRAFISGLLESVEQDTGAVDRVRQEIVRWNETHANRDLWLAQVSRYLATTIPEQPAIQRVMPETSPTGRLVTALQTELWLNQEKLRALNTRAATSNDKEKQSDWSARRRALLSENKVLQKQVRLEIEAEFLSDELLDSADQAEYLRLLRQRQDAETALRQQASGPRDSDFMHLLDSYSTACQQVEIQRMRMIGDLRSARSVQSLNNTQE